MTHSNIQYLPTKQFPVNPGKALRLRERISFLRVLLLALFCICLTFLTSACNLGVPKVDPEFKYRMETGHYDSIFLSMCGTSQYAASDFSDFRGTNTYLVPEAVKNEKTLCNYLTQAYQVNPELSVVFLQLDPENLDLSSDPEKNQTKNSLLRLMAEHPDTVYQIIMPHPSLSYLTSLSEAKRDKAQEAGIRLLTSVSYSAKGSNLPGRVHLYFPGAEEWLISNPANYETDYITVPQIAQKLMLLCFCDGVYEITTANVDDYYSALYKRCTEQTAYPDLSGKNYVFIGDSIFGNDSGVLSIPGMISGLTNAKTYNLGIGGATAADCTTAPTSYEKIVDTFEDSITPDVVFINFGLNDYMQGVHVESYKKALINQTTRLMKAYPDTHFVLLSPSYCTFFKEGTECRDPEGSPLEAYRTAAKEAADTLGVACFDSYNLLGFDASNADLYLADGCHMTEAGRFIMSRKLIEFISPEFMTAQTSDQQ